MSQDPLAPLLAPLTTLPGIGPVKAGLLTRAIGGTRVLDVLLHLPEGLIDRSARPTIAAALALAKSPDSRPPAALVATLAVTVLRHDAPATRRQPWRVQVADATGTAELVFFAPQRLSRCPVGADLLVSGKLDIFDNRLVLTHPDYIVPADRPEQIPRLDPVWPLTAGLFGGDVARAMRAALSRLPGQPGLPALPEWHDPALLKREKWPDFATAIRALQTPEVPPDALPRRRLAYDELLAHQLAIGWMRRRVRHRPGRALVGDNQLRAAALARFGHTPTGAQIRAVAEIDADLARPTRMLRLLQGDVGSGKTLVAVLAMLRAVEAGGQAALMAPTELLAQQHLRSLEAISPVPVVLLTGSVKGAARRRILAAIADGTAKLVVGTHALFQDQVAYHDLALAVIDEQHRFGVDQRLLLSTKGRTTDVLVMTATPIPRSLLLTQWGEMEVSRLDEKPAGRQPIRTSIHSLATLPDVVEGIARALAGGASIYWVCPLVSESELIDLAAAEARFADLASRFGDRVGLAHGRQDSAVRDAALAEFAGNPGRILVATTVVEVGVDVAAASVMVIEHAERFGLAQLHQLRGRVGRGAAQSFCLLLHEDGLSELARRRLLLLRDTEDGFVIADEDFRLRGGGDLLGTRQSGLPGYRLADPVEDEGLLVMAARDSAVILERDPNLKTERGQALRLLLRLFDRVAAMRTLRAG